MEKEIESGEYIFGEYIFDEYTIAYGGKGFQVFEIINEGNKGIIVISRNLSELIGCFIYDEEKKTMSMTEIYTKSFKICDKRIEVIYNCEF